MKFEFLIAVEIKNDGLTQDADPDDLAMMIQNRLEDNLLHELPWVLSQDIKLITRDTRRRT